MCDTVTVTVTESSKRKCQLTASNTVSNWATSISPNLYLLLWSEKYYDLAFTSVSVSKKIYEYLLIFPIEIRRVLLTI